MNIVMHNAYRLHFNLFGKSAGPVIFDDRIKCTFKYMKEKKKLKKKTLSL